jgi:hypothetical protein
MAIIFYISNPYIYIEKSLEKNKSLPYILMVYPSAMDEADISILKSYNNFLVSNEYLFKLL